MAPKKNDRHMIPEAADLERFGKFCETGQGILLNEVDKNGLIEVQTLDITLKIAVRDKDDGTVVVQGQSNEKFFTKPEICHLSGSTLGGSFIKTGWIEVGFKLELHRLQEPLWSKERVITTSTIQTIIVWSDPETVLEFLRSV